MTADLAPTALLGAWTLAREIDDRMTAEQSTVDGTSELSLEPDGRVRWSEQGTLRSGELVLPVSRLLFVEPRDDEWFVTFDDGRDFHPWSPGGEVVHPCAPDTYVGRVDILSDDHWRVEWAVSGPAKDYTMTSVLVRAQPNENA